MIDWETEYYYGFELRLTPKGVYVSGRNDSRYGSALRFDFFEDARAWIEETVGLNKR